MDLLSTLGSHPEFLRNRGLRYSIISAATVRPKYPIRISEGKQLSSGCELVNLRPEYSHAKLTAGVYDNCRAGNSPSTNASDKGLRLGSLRADANGLASVGKQQRCRYRYSYCLSPGCYRLQSPMRSSLTGRAVSDLSPGASDEH
jgi:hypothetical protein